EIVVVDDGSTDATTARVRECAQENPEVRLFQNAGRNGYGMAVRVGLEKITGDAVAIVMGDGSDSSADVIGYYRKLVEGYDCVFGSRFMRGSKVIDYPLHHLILTRMANW